MESEIKRCIIVSGAPNPDLEFINKNTDNSAYIIAADSGYKALDAIGVTPDLIIGDFDSSDKPSINCEIEVYPIEKDYTDTFNCVRAAVDRGYNDILILNALGSRFDHSYSNVLCLEYCKKAGVNCIIANRNNRIRLICDTLTFTKEYQWFSLFAFLEECRGVVIKGAHYTADFFDKKELDIKPYDQFAQSNYIENDECTVSLKSGTLLLVESND